MSQTASVIIMSTVQRCLKGILINKASARTSCRKASHSYLIFIYRAGSLSSSVQLIKGRGAQHSRSDVEGVSGQIWSR